MKNLFCWAAGWLLLMTVQGCAELHDQRKHGSITFAPESEVNARMETIDMAYVRNWLKARDTSPEELLGKTPDEVLPILGRPKHKVTRVEMCGPNPAREASLREHPEHQAQADATDKYWCEEDHMQWSYNIPRWFYINGNTFCEVVFENGKVKSVGNLTAQF